MKKEVIIAVIAGLTLGLVITVGIYTANRSLNQQRLKKLEQNSPTPSLSPSNLNNKTINLTSVENYDLFDQSDLSLSGVAWPDAVVALTGDADTQIIKADSEGIFTFNTKLAKGFNEITLIAADETETIQTLNLVLTYSTSKVEPLSFNWPALISSVYAAQQDATPASETVTDKIKERLQNTVEEGLTAIKEQITEQSTAPRKKAYVGKITNIAADALTLNYKDQNFNVKFNKNTIYVKGVNSPLLKTDLKTGNWLIAMGWYSSNSQEFTAARVSVIAAPEPPLNHQLITGKITEVDGQKLTVNGKILTLSKKTDLTVSGITKPTADDLALGDNLFAIVTLDGNGDLDSVNAVYIIPGKNNPATLTPTNMNATASGNASASSKDAE